METQSVQLIELSLDQAIETKLVQGNVTQQIIAELNEKYGGLKLKALDDKEGYLEIKAAAKDCAKIRTLAVKLCKEGRDEALKTQKAWVAKEKEVVGQVALVEDALDAEVSKFDAEVLRIQTEEKERKEEAYINRQAELNKMGATYLGGCFVLGEVSFEANLIKDSSDLIWTSSVLPAFEEEYWSRERVRIEQEKEKELATAELKRQQQELADQQDQFKQQQAQAKADQDQRDAEAKKIIDDAVKRKQAAMFILQKERFEMVFPVAKYGEELDTSALFSYTQDDFDRILKSKTEIAVIEMDKISKATEQKRLDDIESATQVAVRLEQSRVEAAIFQKQTDLDAASDKVKWNHFLKQVGNIQPIELSSRHYRTKMLQAMSLIKEIIAL